MSQLAFKQPMIREWASENFHYIAINRNVENLTIIQLFSNTVVK